MDNETLESHAREIMKKLEAHYTGQDNPVAGALKHDQGKPRVGLMMRGFPRALMAVAEVTTFGARKYAPDGWQFVEDGINRYNDALDRHLLARGIEPTDRESGLLHLAHAAWNALAVLELELRRYEEVPVESNMRIR